MSKTTKKTLPYANTKIPAEDTIANIKKLLKNHGIQDIQETTLSGKSILRFIFHSPSRDVSFEIKPPTLTAAKKTYDSKSGRYISVNYSMDNQAWRLVYWYLEAKLKAVQYGLVSIEREFLNQMLTGGENTVGDYIIEQLERDKGVLRLEAPKTEVNPKIVDGDYVVKDQ